MDFFIYESTTDVDKWITLIDSKGFPWAISVLFIIFLLKELLRKQKQEEEDDELKRRLKENLEKILKIEKQVEIISTNLSDIKSSSKEVENEIKNISVLIERISGSVSSIKYTSRKILEEITGKKESEEEDDF